MSGPVPERHVVREVEIHAPASSVWDVLVMRTSIEVWAREFSEGNIVTEDWQLGSSVAMTDDDGRIVQHGSVTVFEPYERLQLEFEEDGYTEVLGLSTRGSSTLLTSRAGPVHEDEYDAHSSVWDRGLQKIKQLSEAQ